MEPDESEKYDKSIHHPERGIGVAKPSFNDHHRLKWFAPGHVAVISALPVFIVISRIWRHRQVARRNHRGRVTGKSRSACPLLTGCSPIFRDEKVRGT